MKMTRERTIFFGLLVIAAGGLSFDRLTATSNAAETTPADDLIAMPQASAHHSQVATNRSTQHSLSQRLAEMCKRESTTHLIDPFSQSSNEQAADASRPGQLMTPARFAAVHRLTATTSSARGAAAVIDNEITKIGASLNGYRLIAVDAGSATFSADNTTFKLLFAPDRH